MIFHASCLGTPQVHQHPDFLLPFSVQNLVLLSVTDNVYFSNIFFVFVFFRLSGFMLPSPIVSSGSILALWFTTDFAVSAQGFKAVYEGKTTREDACA